MGPAPAGKGEAVRPGPGWGKRWLFRLAVAACLYGLLEGGSLLTFRVITGEPFHFSLVRGQQGQLLRQDEQPEGPPAKRSAYALHPFLGFVYDPTWPKPIPGDNPVTEWGFTGKGPFIHHRSPGRVIVGILGASVASMFSAQGTAALERELKRSPRYRGKELVFVNLAVGGFKQPQQVMALNYALAMGAEFDLVLNLDGFNEVAWYPHDNRAAEVYPLFPAGWHWLVGAVPDAARRRQLGRLAVLEDTRADWAQLSRAAPFRYSVTWGLLWKVRDQALEAQVVQLTQELRRAAGELPYRATGPRHRFANDAEMFAELATLWKRCSVQLDRICRAHDIRYYHFLQPNQYVPGSKELSAEERRKAYLDSYPVRPFVAAGYPLLRQAGTELARQGVRFRDLSMLFAGHGETLYVDNCCHLNRSGNELLATSIAEAVLETPEPPRP